MFCVIYRFILKPQQEDIYKKCWNLITDYFIQHRGAIGSSLHKSNDNLWIAYSRWPNQQARDASWPGDDKANQELPENIVNAIKIMQKIKNENKHLEQYDEITMQLVEDKITIT